MALIKDIRFLTAEEIPRNEYIAVDTNILLFKFYSRLSQTMRNNSRYQIIYYPNFIDTLLENGNKLFTTYLNLAEFCSVVERNECRIYNRGLADDDKLNFKEYRNLETQRVSNCEILQGDTEEIVVNMNRIFTIVHDSNVVNSFLQSFVSTHCDIADYTVIEYMKSLGITNFISDDKDFTTVDGITLYTTYKDSYYQTQNTDDRSNSAGSGRSGARSSGTNLNRLNVFSGSRPQSHSQSH